MAAGAGVGLLFFAKVVPVLLSCLLGAFLFPIYLQKRKSSKERLRMESDCCAMLQALTAALRSGKSFDNALITTLKEAPQTPFGEAWGRMCGKVSAARPPEEAFAEMADECSLAELRQLSAVISITRRNGGNLSATIGETVGILRDKQRARNEIAVLLARKQNEQRIMNLIPFALILIMRVIAGSYLSPLYETTEGVLIMSTCLLLILLGWFLSEKISGGALA